MMTNRAVLLEAGWELVALNAMTNEEIGLEAARALRLKHTGHDDAGYRKAYRRGWATSMRVGNLDRADADGRSSDDAWMDGYLDAAAGREEFHMLFCTDHDNCD